MEDSTSRRSVIDALERMSDKLEVVENEQVRMNGRIGRLEESLYGEKSQFSPEPNARSEGQQMTPEPRMMFESDPKPQDGPVVYPPQPQTTHSWLHKGPRLADPPSKFPQDSGMKSTYQSDYSGRYDYSRVIDPHGAGLTFMVPTSGRKYGHRIVAEDAAME